MIFLFLILAPLSRTFIYDALWWRWVSMFIVHVPLLIMEVVAVISFSWYYYASHKRNALNLKRSPHLFHILQILFPISLLFTHMCTIATASWWFLLPAALPTTCAYVLCLTQVVERPDKAKWLL